jgi:hypothetical protein
MHPFTPNLSSLTTEELNTKYNELIKRFDQAHRWGKPDLVGQLQLLIQDYKEEIDNRHRKSLEEMEKNSKSFKGIINIQ